VFDLDGTLIDSRRDLADAANALIVERGGAPLDVDQVAAMVGEGASMLVRRALAAARIERADIDRALHRFLELYDERLLVHTRVYEGTHEALQILEQRASLAILTNKPQHHTERLLAGIGLEGYFRWVVGGDTPHGRKPDPAGMNHLMAMAESTPDDTVMIGDSAIDLFTARSAGTRVCLVRYGFGFHSTAGRLRGDEMFVDRPEELPRLLSSAF